MLLDGEDHQLFKDFVSHEELLGCSGDVSVVVEDPHARVSGRVYLDGNVSSQIKVVLGLLGWVHSRVKSC